MTNLFLFSLAIAKVALLTGIGPAIAIAIFLELRGIRIVAIGFERVSGRAVSRRAPCAALSNGNQPARKVLEAS